MAKRPTATTSTSKSTLARPGDNIVLRVELSVNPVPASRPRVSRWGTYYAKTYKNWMKEAAEKLADLGITQKFHGEVEVTINHVIAKPKTSDRSYPRGDVDNYAKATLDALTKAGIGWHDDDQVVVLTATKRFAQPNETPHAFITVLPR